MFWIHTWPATWASKSRSSIWHDDPRHRDARHGSDVNRSMISRGKLKSAWKLCRYQEGAVLGESRSLPNRFLALLQDHGNCCASFWRRQPTVRFTASYQDCIWKSRFSIRHNCLFSATPMRLLALVFVTRTADLDWNYCAQRIHK